MFPQPPSRNHPQKRARHGSQRSCTHDPGGLPGLEWMLWCAPQTSFRKGVLAPRAAGGGAGGGGGGETQRFPERRSSHVLLTPPSWGEPTPSPRLTWGLPALLPWPWTSLKSSPSSRDTVRLGEATAGTASQLSLAAPTLGGSTPKAMPLLSLLSANLPLRACFLGNERIVGGWAGHIFLSFFLATPAVCGSSQARG